MMFRSNVVHANSGKVFVGEIVEGTQEEFEEAQEELKYALKNNINYLQMGNVILPGKFLLERCYFQFEILD